MPSIRSTIYLFLVLLCFPILGFSQTFHPMKDSKAFQEELHQVAAKTKALESDFTQIKHLDVLSEDIESTGRLIYKATNNLRWEYSAPLNYLIVLSQGKISIKDEDKVSSYDLSGNQTFEKVNEMIIGSIQGDLLLEEQDYRYEFKESSQQYLVVLFPKQAKVQEFMKSINIYFSKKDYSVQQLQMMEQSGDFTRITFSNKKINGNISDAVFRIH
ncbi:MAG: LolA family protein [Aureispira sp.]